MLSRADVFLGRVSRRQQYSLWGYVSDLMSAGVALAKRRRYVEFNRYRFPMWLVKRSRLRGGGRVQREVLGKIGGYTHRSGYAARHQMLPLFRRLFEIDHAFAVRFVRELKLEPEHIAYMLDVESVSPRVRGLMEAAWSDDPDRGVATSMREFDAGAEDAPPAAAPEPAPGKAGKAPPAKKAGKKPKEVKLGGSDWEEEKEAEDGGQPAKAESGEEEGRNQKSLLDF
jgi:replication factor C large subunit